MVRMRGLILVLTFLLLEAALAFTPIRIPSVPSRTHHTVHNVVFTKLSDECLSALGVAQEQAQLSGKREIDETFLLLGLTEHPGKCKTLFDQYSINWSKIRRTLNYFNDGASTKQISLADFKDQSDALLPYSKGLQECLFEAGRISQIMGNAQIETEHVFLSLLHYKEVDGEVFAATRGDDCYAMEILYHDDATLEGEDMCIELLQQLMSIKTKADEHITEKDKDNVNMVLKDEKVRKGGPPGKKDNKKQSLLKEFGNDLTQQARDGGLDIVRGRDVELEACLRILLRRRKNNVCITGESGVGKTAIAEGLAQVLVSDDCPALLEGHKMISLEISSLLSGTMYRGAFEERFRGILEEVVQGEGRTILFLDELHTLMGSGGSGDGGMDAANLLKPYLARGQLKVVGATTVSEYNKFIAKDAAMDRRFQPVLVKEPSIDATVDILRALVPFYQSHHRVEFAEEALEAAARLSDRYIAERFLPDKAIDLLDEAGAVATLRRVPNKASPVVDEQLITEIVSEWSSIPVGILQMDEKERLEALEEKMAERVKGQERAVKAVAKAIRRARTGVRDPKRPIASFLFSGPTGTVTLLLYSLNHVVYYISSINLSNVLYFRARLNFVKLWPTHTLDQKRI